MKKEEESIIDDVFSAEEQAWMRPLEKVLKGNGVKCDFGSISLMCDIHRLYTKDEKSAEKPKSLAEVLQNACGWSNQVDFNVASKAALAWMRERIEGLRPPKGSFTNRINPDDLLALLQPYSSSEGEGK